MVTIGGHVFDTHGVKPQSLGAIIPDHDQHREYPVAIGIDLAKSEVDPLFAVVRNGGDRDFFAGLSGGIARSGTRCEVQLLVRCVYHGTRGENGYTHYSPPIFNDRHLSPLSPLT